VFSVRQKIAHILYSRCGAEPPRRRTAHVLLFKEEAATRLGSRLVPKTEAAAMARAAFSTREHGAFAPEPQIRRREDDALMGTSPGQIMAGVIAAAAVAVAVALPLILFAAHAAPRPALYIALGDSYAAGDGVPPQLDIPPGCKRSSRSYPEVVARKLGLKPSQ